MSKELVSVVVTTYKREMSLILRTLKSIINQTYKNLDIIIVDDNENDSFFSKDIVDGLLSYPSIRYIKQDGNKGACAARNLGIEAAKGNKVAFLDDDDEWLETKIERQLEVFEKYDDVGMVYCTGYTKIEEKPEAGLLEYYTKSYFKEKVSYRDMLSADFVGTTSNPLIDKKCFKVSGGFEESLPARQDYEMWIRISKKYNVYGLDEQLFIHYIHDGEQISKNHEKSLAGFKYIYKTYKKDYLKNGNSLINILDRLCHEWVHVNRLTSFYPIGIRKYYKLMIKFGAIKG